MSPPCLSTIAAGRFPVSRCAPGAGLSSAWRSVLSIALFVLSAAAGCGFAGESAEAGGGQDGSWRVVARVIDGDTFILAGGDRVRLIGVDTPETRHPTRPVGCYGPEASDFLRRLIEGGRVRLEYDPRLSADRWGRILAYVSTPYPALDVGAEILRRGFGSVYRRSRFERRERYLAIEREARAARRGLWGACPPPG